MNAHVASLFPGSPQLAERERATHLSTGPDTGPLLRTILRLRHDVVMIGRECLVALPGNVQSRLDV